jgi:hypothetical protein
VKEIKSYSKKNVSLIVVVLLLFSIVSQLFIVNIDAAIKISNPGVRGGIDGIDTDPDIGRHNSYAWCGEVFSQTDGDYLWVGMNRDLGAFLMEKAGSNFPLEVFHIPEFSEDKTGRIYRQRASDPDAPWELMYSDPAVSGYRRMIVFDESLYVLVAQTNTDVANYAYVLRFSKDFQYGDKPEIVLWDYLIGISGGTLTAGDNEVYRSVTVLNDRLYIGTFDGKLYSTDGKNLKNLDIHSSEKSTGWELTYDFLANGMLLPIWDILGFNGSLYVFVSNPLVGGFRVFKLTPGANSYTLENPVGDRARYPRGMGISSAVAASGFLSTSFDQDYVYVTTFTNAPVLISGFATGNSNVMETHFTPAAVYRFCANDVWEVVVGDRTGKFVARDSTGAPIPHVGNQRAGFSPLPDDRENISFNQYTWWAAEYEGKFYVSTFNMHTFILDFSQLSTLMISSQIKGSEPIFKKHQATIDILHEYLMRDVFFMDFDKIQSDLDDFFAGVDRSVGIVRLKLSGRLDAVVVELVDEYVDTIARNLPTEDFKIAIQALKPIMLELAAHMLNSTRPIDALQAEPLNDWQAASDMILRHYANTTLLVADPSRELGFQLFVTEDGVNFEPVTLNGFGDKFNYGGRVLVPSEHGFYTLLANPFYGGQVWRIDTAKLGVYPNIPQMTQLDGTNSARMTVQVTDAGSVSGGLRLNYSSTLANVQLVRSSSGFVTNLSWEHELVADTLRNTRYYDITEVETITRTSMYDVIITPLREGRETLTLNFEIGGISVSKDIDLIVNFDGFPDKTALSERISEVRNLRLKDFTNNTWWSFNASYFAALAVRNNINATQKEIDEALANLILAISNLKPSMPAGFTPIRTADDLRRIGTDRTTLAGNYWLDNDIDIGHLNWDSLGSFAAAGHFTGVFEGNGYTIRGLWSSGKGSNQGLFSRINGGVVRDLNIELDPRGITGSGERKGALAGNIYDGALIENVHIRGADSQQSRIEGSANYIAGFVGVVNNATVRNCSVDNVTVRGNEYQGGFAGAVYGRNNSRNLPSRQTLVEYSVVLDDVSIANGYTAGGFAGILYEGASMFRCTSYADVQNRLNYAGGLLGKIHDTLSGNPKTIVEQCAAYGNIVINGYIAGGLIGEMLNSTVVNAYARGNVTSISGTASTSGLGGLVGYASGTASSNKNTITNTYSTGTVTLHRGPSTLSNSTLIVTESGAFLGRSGATMGGYNYFDSDTAGVTNLRETTRTGNTVNLGAWGSNGSLMSSLANGASLPQGNSTSALKYSSRHQIPSNMFITWDFDTVWRVGDSNGNASYPHFIWMSGYAFSHDFCNNCSECIDCGECTGCCTHDFCENCGECIDCGECTGCCTHDFCENCGECIDCGEYTGCCTHDLCDSCDKCLDCNECDCCDDCGNYLCECTAMITVFHRVVDSDVFLYMESGETFEWAAGEFEFSCLLRASLRPVDPADPSMTDGYRFSHATWNGDNELEYEGSDDDGWLVKGTVGGSEYTITFWYVGM